MPIAVRGAPPASLSVGEVMPRGLVTSITDQAIARNATSTAELQAADIIDEASWIPGDARLKEATELMLRKRTSRVLVHGRHEPIGVLFTLDVIDVLAVGDNGVGAEGTERP